MTELTKSSQKVGVMEATEICPGCANSKQQNKNLYFHEFLSFHAYDLQKTWPTIAYLVHPLPPPLQSIEWKDLKPKQVLLEVRFLAKNPPLN